MRSRTRMGLLIAIALLLAAAAQLQATLDARRPVSALEEAELYVRSARVLDRAALSFDAVLADIYWMRAIQHFGGERRAQKTVKRYDLLYPLLDLTTALDPYFFAPYYFGSFFLAEPLPGGAGRPDLAVKLLERGVQRQPDYWRFPQQIGFIYYWYQHDFAQAAEWFRRAAALPDAPDWVTALEATTRAEGGDIETSRRIWQQIIDTAESDWMRETARYRLMQVEALAAVDQLGRMVTQFALAHGHPPASWAELIRAGQLRRVPLDPTGRPYVLGEWGKVTLSPESRLYPLPERPVPSGS